jgi:ferric-dicitrate binding protein FerR (iron transport regulator)
MDRQAFHELLQRYLQGNGTPEENRLIDQWFAQLDQGTGLTLSDHEKQAMEEELWLRISEEIQEPVALRKTSAPTKSIVPAKWPAAAWYSAIAAMLILTVSLLWLAGQKPSSKRVNQPLAVFEKGAALVFHTNQTAHAQKVILEDNSEILLNPGSSIHYPSHFGSRREVLLEGDAFFKVAKNPQKPFFVYSGKIVTQVLGTSFWVKSKEKNKSIQVEVKTGQVSVYERVSADNHTSSSDTRISGKGVVLKPNQQATYFTENRHWETSLVEQPAVVAANAAAPLFIYHDASLTEVMRDLEKGFGIEVITANSQLKACTFTGDIAQLTLYEKLDLVCKSIKANYEIRGTHIVINGKGCE